MVGGYCEFASAPELLIDACEVELQIRKKTVNDENETEVEIDGD